MDAGDRGTASPSDVDVAIVGGGPAGCSAGIFTARYGLDTVIFDRGTAALRRSAYLANFLGFPAGIDIDTFYELMHDHVDEAGCTLVEDMVVSITRPDDTGSTRDPGPKAAFRIQTQEGRSITATRVIAAAWYDGDYMRPLGGEEMFEMHEHHGETEERFAAEYADEDGRTPIEGLYVAAPCGERNAQAIIAAGQGAHVARCLLRDHRMVAGYPAGVIADHYDWLRPESEFQGGWETRARWREWFDNELPDDHDLSETEKEQLREQYIDRAFETKLTESQISRRMERGHRRLLAHLDDRLVLERAQAIRAERTAGDDGSHPGQFHNE